MIRRMCFKNGTIYLFLRLHAELTRYSTWGEVEDIRTVSQAISSYGYYQVVSNIVLPRKGFEGKLFEAILNPKIGTILGVILIYK
jgi:hypothetical protein